MSKALRISLEILVLAAVPAVLVISAATHYEQASILTLVVCIGSLFIFFLGYERSKPPVRLIMPVVVLGSLAAAGRVLFAAFADFKPVTAICVIAGAVFGRYTGFMVGAFAALVSNIFFGQGPWTPWQMYAWGLCGYFAGVFFFGRMHVDASSESSAPVKRRLVLLCIYGAVASLCFGMLLNLWFMVGYVNPINLETILATVAGSIVLDIIHASATVIFLLVLYVPWAIKLERVRLKYNLA